MAQDVITYHTSGKTTYYVIYDTGELYWSGASFEQRNPSHWVDYAQPLTETVPGTYAGPFPSVIGPGLYNMIGYEQLGASPSPSDKLFSAGMMDWDGSKEWSGGVLSGGSTAVQYSLGMGIISDIGQIDSGVESSGEGFDLDSGVEDDETSTQIDSGVDGEVRQEITTGVVSPDPTSQFTTGVE